MRGRSQLNLEWKYGRADEQMAALFEAATGKT
jgi:hypothetical protein